MFDELDIPYGRVQRMEELPDDPHLRAVGMFEQYEHPTEGRMRQVRQPVTVTGAEKVADNPPPILGQHSSEILRDFGFGSGRIDELKKAGIIGGD